MILIALLLVLAQDTTKADTIWLKEGFVYIQYNKYGGAHKVRTKYIIKKGSHYFVNGKERIFIKHVDSLHRN